MLLTSNEFSLIERGCNPLDYVLLDELPEALRRLYIRPHDARSQYYWEGYVLEIYAEGVFFHTNSGTADLNWDGNFISWSELPWGFVRKYIKADEIRCLLP